MSKHAADFGTADRALRGALVIERETQTDASGKVTGTTHRARDPEPTALHVIAARIDMDPELRRVGEHLQELCQRAALVTRFGPSWAKSASGPEITDAQAEAHREWNACINAIPAYAWRNTVRSVCLCDELDGRHDLLTQGLEAVKRYLGW
jgi:hypothetical protein